MQTLDSIIDQVTTLPPAPRILPKLLAVLRKEEADASEVVGLIMFDQALTAQVIRRCNSVQYGLVERVQDLQAAVVQVGMGEIYRLVANVLGEGLLTGAQSGYGIDRGELWKHSAATAVAAQVIARERGGDEAVVFTAALLHDIGKLVLSTRLEGAYDKIVTRTDTDKLSFIEAEKAILGFEHAEVGAHLLARWNFPDQLVRAVRHHHNPALAETARELAAYVHLGDVIAHMLGHGYGHQAYAVRCHPEALEILEFKGSDLEQLVIMAATSAEEILSSKSAT